MSPAPKSKSGKAQRPMNKKGSARRQAQSPAVRRALRREAPAFPSELVLGPVNYLLMALGAVAIVLGFVLLSFKEISISPILLVGGYCMLIPAGLLIRSLPRGKPADTTQDTGMGE